MRHLRHLLMAGITIWVVAIATIVPTAGAASATPCSDLGYVKAGLYEQRGFDEARADETLGKYKTASIWWLLTWQIERGAPVPCSTELRIAHTYKLRALHDSWLSDNDFSRGNVVGGRALQAASSHEAHLEKAALLTYFKNTCAPGATSCGR